MVSNYIYYTWESTTKKNQKQSYDGLWTTLNAYDKRDMGVWMQPTKKNTKDILLLWLH